MLAGADAVGPRREQCLGVAASDGHPVQLAACSCCQLGTSQPGFGSHPEAPGFGAHTQGARVRRAAVEAHEQRVGAVGRQHDNLLGPHLPGGRNLRIGVVHEA